MLEEERTGDLYEEIQGYPKPPLIPLPQPGSWEPLEQLGFKSTPLSRVVLNAVMTVTGFKAFQEELPDQVEHLLRTTDLREGGLFAPTLAATVAIKDDSRDLRPVERAATMLFAARSLYEDVMSGNLPPDEYRGQALEMGQYPNLFSTSLVVDGKRTRIFKSTNTSRVIVAVARRFYALDVGTLGSGTTLAALIDALDDLIQRADGNRLRADEPCPGLLTCGTTAAQRRAFSKLQREESNTASLAALRHSFLTLCLDLDHFPTSYAEAARIAQTGNCANRWYHSSFQLVVFGNAKACMIFNFGAYLDGNVMARAAVEIQRRADACVLARRKTDAQVAPQPATELNWRIDQGLIARAYRDLRSVLDNQKATFELKGIGRRFFSAHGVRSVPVFVLALQMTVNRLAGKTVNIDQFLTMTKYRCMDVVTAMVTTPEVIRFVEHMAEAEHRDGRATTLLHEAVDSQLCEARRVRRHLPFGVILSLFIASKARVGRLLTLSTTGLAIGLLRMLGLYEPVRRRQVLISHPRIYSEVPVFGRPGVRLPYVQYIGLHYQIMRDNIVITLMPGVDWTIPNAEFIAVLQQSLDQIREVICNEG